MHIHILGICGTFMGGIAVLARELGHKVTGSDANVYPPMSTMLESQGIEIIQGFDDSQLKPHPDLVIIGNAMSRGNPCVEYVLNHNLRYTSGPQWLQEGLLFDRWVLAVAGTHGKTTTSSMLTWILEHNGYQPGFLVGGVLGNFGISARLGNSPFFVVEADEYDSAFFDKRSKFVHYRPRSVILNNLEFDHADIFEDLAAIQKQFHHLVRTVPGQGKVFLPADEPALKQVLDRGCWSECEYLHADNGWSARKLSPDGSHFEVYFQQQNVGEVKWSLIGDHNVNNALMAIAAARHVGVVAEHSCEALGLFVNTQRRMELKGEVEGVKVYDDFAHHPTAIDLTIAGLRNHIQPILKQGEPSRLVAVLEARSATMKQGVHKDSLAQSLASADVIYLYQDPDLPWSLEEVAAQCKQPVHVLNNIEQLSQQLVSDSLEGDHLLIMSNGGFGGLHQKVIDGLRRQALRAAVR